MWNAQCTLMPYWGPRPNSGRAGQKDQFRSQCKAGAVNRGPREAFKSLGFSDAEADIASNPRGYRLQLAEPDEERIPTRAEVKNNGEKENGSEESAHDGKKPNLVETFVSLGFTEEEAKIAAKVE